MNVPKFINTWRPKCSNPCAICGWGPAYAIHLPALTGPRKGQPWGHAHQPNAEAPDQDASSRSGGMNTTPSEATKEG